MTRMPPDARAGMAGSNSRATVLGTVVLLAVATIVGSAALAFGGGRPGWGRSVALAAAVCLPGSLAGWIVPRLAGTGPALAVAGSLAAIALRIFPPLAALAWLSAGGADSTGPEYRPLLVVFYLVLLATDILLNIMLGHAQHSGKRTPD